MASYQLPTPRPMCCTGDVAQNWGFFREAYEDYVLASEISKKPKDIQVATLRMVMGDECKKILKRLKLSDADRQEPLSILNALQVYFVPSRNILYERYLFHGADQSQTELVEQYFIRLRQLASTCEFGELEDEMVRDRLVLGCLDKNARARLFRESSVDLNRALESLRISESTHNQLKQISPDVSSETVNVVGKQRAWSPPKRDRPNGHSQKRAMDRTEYIGCYYCGGRHVRQKTMCPAFGKACKACGGRNHFKVVCKRINNPRESKQYVNVCSQQEQDNTTSDEDTHDLLTVDEVGAVDSNNGKKFYAKLVFQGPSHGKEVQCQLDTGATCNVMAYKDYAEIMGQTMPKVSPSKALLRMYGGSKMVPVGKCCLDSVYKGKMIQLEFQLVHGDQPPLLSGSACIDLGMITVHTVRAVEALVKPIVDQFPDVFVGLGCLGGKYEIAIDPGVRPVQQAPRRVPMALKEALKAKIEEMVKQEVIVKVSEPTEWISSLVTVLKPGKMRICLDPRDLNKAILRPKYQTPTIEEVLPKIVKAKIFTLLDAKDGFHQVKLSEPSSYLTTFWTPFGRYRYLRMPFGISSAPEEFQRRMHEAMEGLAGVEVIHDDILVYGSGDSPEEYVNDHNRNLLAVLKRAREINLKFNKKKMRLGLPQITFMGHILSKEGVRVDPEKVSAILGMERPQDKKAVQRFLGCVNYLSRFLPMLSTVCEPLRRLTEKLSVFHWESQQEEAFSKLKELVSTTPVLKFYNVKEPVELQCDASEFGLGAVLLQNGQPVAFASRALSPTERCYAQIEKECLSIVFGCGRFDQYVHGRERIGIETDHKPLIPIFKKSLHSAPRRLQRMLLRLQRYNLEVVYKPGAKMYIADMLSRACTTKQPMTPEDECHIFQMEDENDLFHEISQVDVLKPLPISDKGWDRLKMATSKDQTLVTLKGLILSGWNNSDGIPESVQEYKTFKEELTVQDGVLVKGQRVIIPQAMRREILSKIHTSHLGLEASIRRAKEVVFWPGLVPDIKRVVDNCDTCRCFMTKQQKEPLMPHPVPTRPWQVVGQDLFSYSDRNYLVTVDYYSDYWELDLLSNTTSASVIQCTKSHFARHGAPERVVTANDPQFSSHEYAGFAQAWEFDHVTTSPWHSQSNGKVESAVKIAKKLVKKSLHAGQDLYIAMLEWRNTPQKDCNVSPVQKIMSRRTRTLLPVLKPLLSPKIVKGIPAIIERRRSDAKYYYDRGSRELPVIEVKEKVRIQPSPFKKIWTRGVCVSKEGPRSYVVETENGRMLKRNRRFLRSTPETRDFQFSKEDEGTSEDSVQQTDSATEQAGHFAEKTKSLGTMLSGQKSSSPEQTFETARPHRVNQLPTRFKDFIMT